MPHRQAAAYRQRATHLRTLATEMVNTPSMSLHLHADVDTWYGHRADAYVTELTDEIERLLDGGGSAEEVEREIRNLRILVEELGGDDTVTTLDDLRLAPDRYTAAEDAELAD